MRLICSLIQAVIIHGLGLIIKAALRDYMRLGMLSKYFAMVDGELVVLRKLDNTILTNTTCSQKITKEEGHYLAALSLQSYSMDPLTSRLSSCRLELVTGEIRLAVVETEFLKERYYKCGVPKMLSASQAAKGYGVSLPDY